MPLSLFNHRRNFIQSFNQLYVKFIERNTDKQKKSLMEVHTVFLFVICHIHRWKYWWNEAGNFVFWGTFVGSKFITDRPQITDESFYDKVFSSVSLSVKFVPTDWENKYQQKNSDSKFKNFGSAGHNLLIKNNSLNKSLMNW
jgi:hypothetical protein